ncbi:MAG TPA: nucleotide sugar dehydrogenase [Nitrososphaera sp.]|nr:nucleotide sugar dehydrogenase [Nitrososphaera sp.]
MTKIGFVGLGKLGLPCALAMEHYGGHTVVGYDINPEVANYISSGSIPYREEGVEELLKETKIRILDTVFDVVQESDIVFVPIQTPHDPRFEGVTKLTEERADFDYTFLRKGVEQIALACLWQKKPTTVVIISTVLPGTTEREIKPLLNKYVRLCYNPYFIAMGTTIADFIDPEFVLLGHEDSETAQQIKTLYQTIHDQPVFETNIATAELIKVAYNTFIGMKIVFINTMMEICHRTDADVDELTDALSLATTRLLSPKYLRGGMGDGGGCHPRDNIAMSWLASKLNLSHNIFDDLMKAREDQTNWLARMVGFGDEVFFLGKAYKPETNLTVGSPALLLQEMVYWAKMWDPYIDPPSAEPHDVGVYIITTNHAQFAHKRFAPGSTVIDPWGYIPDQSGVNVIRLGRKKPLS